MPKVYVPYNRNGRNLEYRLTSTVDLASLCVEHVCYFAISFADM
jgi:hypothetical protein